MRALAAVGPPERRRRLWQEAPFEELQNNNGTATITMKDAARQRAAKHVSARFALPRSVALVVVDAAGLGRGCSILAAVVKAAQAITEESSVERSGAEERGR